MKTLPEMLAARPRPFSERIKRSQARIDHFRHTLRDVRQSWYYYDPEMIEQRGGTWIKAVIAYRRRASKLQCFFRGHDDVTQEIHRDCWQTRCRCCGRIKKSDR